MYPKRTVVWKGKPEGWLRELRVVVIQWSEDPQNLDVFSEERCEDALGEPSWRPVEDEGAPVRVQTLALGALARLTGDWTIS